MLLFIFFFFSPVANDMYDQWRSTDEAASLLSDYQDTVDSASNLLNGYVLDLTTVEELADALQSAYELRFHLLLSFQLSCIFLQVQARWMNTSLCIRMSQNFK